MTDLPPEECFIYLLNDTALRDNRTQAVNAPKTKQGLSLELNDQEQLPLIRLSKNGWVVSTSFYLYRSELLRLHGCKIHIRAMLIF